MGHSSQDRNLALLMSSKPPHSALNKNIKGYTKYQLLAYLANYKYPFLISPKVLFWEFYTNKKTTVRPVCFLQTGLTFSI